jgi:hypothetical protein
MVERAWLTRADRSRGDIKMPTTLERASRSAERLSEIKIPQLPLREHGLTHVPAIPLDFVGMIDQLIRLGGKLKQREQALQGLSTPTTIGRTTAPAHAFLFGREPADTQTTKALERVRAVLNRNPLGILSSLVDALKSQEKELIRTAPAGDALTTRSLDDPTQWSMGWTTFPDARSLGLPHLDEWAATLDVAQPDKATEAFFPTIARYGRSYNLILTRKVKTPDAGEWRALFGSAWTRAFDRAADTGLLYVIDLRVFETLKPQKIEGSDRFTPSTVTVLVQDPATKALTPELVRVAGGDNEPKIFSRRGSTTPFAWLYALQAAKVSVTVYGIWLGHVYQWHLVTAAMLMTMFENLSPMNPARKLLEPQSSHLIPGSGCSTASCTASWRTAVLASTGAPIRPPPSWPTFPRAFRTPPSPIRTRVSARRICSATSPTPARSARCSTSTSSSGRRPLTPPSCRLAESTPTCSSTTRSATRR